MYNHCHSHQYGKYTRPRSSTPIYRMHLHILFRYQVKGTSPKLQTIWGLHCIRWILDDYYLSEREIVSPHGLPQ